MPCYNPIVAFKDYDSGLTDNGKFMYRLNGRYDPDYLSLAPRGDVIKIPCGKCLGCRLDYSRRWADRMYLEFLSTGEKAIFVTLTYDDDHIPGVFDSETGELLNYSLCKRDGQLFFKSLRKAFYPRTLRYYLCGEYGGRTRRPHMHCIIFGLDLREDFPLRDYRGHNDLGQCYFSSPILSKIWKNGFHCISDVSYKTMAYVSRYVMKKVYHLEEPDDAEPEFCTMSRRPGIGAYYFEQHPDICSKDHIYFNDGSTNYKISVPKYFLKKMQLIDPEGYDKLMSQKRSVAYDRDLLKLQQTDLSYQETLSNEEDEKFNKTKILFKLREEV